MHFPAFVTSLQVLSH